MAVWGASVTLCVAALLLAVHSEPNVPPVVIMHGILGSAERVDIIADWIREAIPGIYVHNMEVGNGAGNSMNWPMDRQVATFCENIYLDPKLERGFNLIGFSQGGLIARGYIERCNKFPVINFMSWTSPQGGQFGGIQDIIAPELYVLFNAAPYSDAFRNLSLSGYWRDPYRLPEYLEKSSFLADINNEREQKNQQYKNNIMSLKTMMLLYSTLDQVVSPPESAAFAVFQAWTGPGSKGVVIPLFERDLYQEDWLGLRVLNDTQRLVVAESDCEHHEHPTEACKHVFEQTSLPLLKQNWTEVETFWKEQRIQAQLES
eukprot:m.46356 g.46356  ORF g.46356 m.46356 type:complete len:317 (-) comp10918_c0_seq2:777-1727(-)